DIDRARSDAPDGAAAPAPAPGVDAARRQRELCRLVTLLKRWDLAAEATWEGIAPQFSGPDAEALGRTLAALDYAAAARHARALLAGVRCARVAPPPEPVADEAPPRILVVDDAPENIRFVARILGQVDAEVSFAVGGVAGLERARTQMPDLILLDVEMPDMSGYDVIRALKDARETRHVPVIFLTGRSTEADEASGLELGAIDYVTKPFNASVVVARVRNQLRIVEYARKLHALNAELERRATTDPLTGLPNRRAFYEMAERELIRLRRFGEQMAVLMFDVDHFKKVNDTHGHDAGDVVLRVVAERLAAVIRKTDFLARLGGEEFVVLMPKTDMEGARVVAARLLSGVRGEPIRISNDVALTVTATLGVSLARAEDVGIDDALKRADLALYEGKAAGRNRVVEA
ncbi:MAG: diguanylate cyclase, partial [Rubrimonas sp.]